ncbi:uncharacterized protein LOC121293784 [Carcharodon carcharias]|uniref:uncharacterized protein LOC121293784 n=1 Tax=Carcharodon carcharias TaxID=13397 RepID=UPI001B7D9201|nr:uncharacterized protein LOC121293784 [Carcharodon carcharias]XP_041073046.1 uncharacterized protein LOC121293784 [Carcharodon carcharias]
MNGMLLIQVFAIVVLAKTINAETKELTPQFERTGRRSSSTGLQSPSVNLTKLPHKNRSRPESSLPVLDAFFEREESPFQQYKIKNENSHAEGKLSPLVFFEKNSKRNESTGRQNYKATAKEHPEKQERWQSNDLRGLISSFYPDKSRLNRSPTYYSLLAKSMQASSSTYLTHNYHQATWLHHQISATHRVTKQGERATSYNLDPEENRPRKTIHYRTSGTFINGINSSSVTNRHPSSLLYHFNILREDYNKELCSIECRKEKNEREFYCNSEFAISGIVHDIVTLGKGLRLVTLLVDSNGFYRMNRLYVTPDGFFFKVHILVVDTFNCRRSCPDLKFGGKYIMMGLIYHRRYSLPTWVQEHVSGKLKPGDGLVRSSSYVRRYNRKRNQRVQLVRDGKCGGAFLRS